ncbi:unnamed protein product [Parajaminaea phylloscopi]
MLPSSSLQPPSDPRCIFFRTKEDIDNASASNSGAATPTTILKESARLDLLAMANINPLTEAAAKTLDPETNVVLASRTSQLALVQSSQVSHMLSQAFDGSSTAASSSSSSSALGITKPISFPITSMSTAGDHNLKSPLYVIGGEGKAIWTKELEVALKVGGVDVLVHSLKDIPTTLPEEFVLGAILEREDPRDALVVKAGLPYRTLDDLPPGSVIGTSSVRRVAQLRSRYPSLVFSDVRGNLNTRLAKLDAPTGPYTAIVLAAAGLIRINLSHRITAFLSKPVMLHSVGQGSLALEVRKPPPGADPKTNRDARILEMVKRIGDWRATARAEAERSLLRELEGGCSIPVGVETKFEDHEEIEAQRNERVDAVDEAELGGAVAEGHTITRNAVASTSSTSSNGTDGANGNHPTRPQTLERLATGAGQNGQHEATPSAGTTSLASGIPLKPYSPIHETSHLPPSSPIGLTLTAVVVSLDGRRSCSSSYSAKIASYADATELGIRVARELREEKGARAILEEVERHRHIAEQADARRRGEAAALKAQKQALAEQTGPAHVHAADHTAPHTNGADEALRRLEELVPQAKGEMDRRGVPRADGQAKVWEV